MRHKIVALTATALKVGLCTHPASAEAVAGMETALIALNGVLRKLTYFNACHKAWELGQQLEREATNHAAQEAEQAAYLRKLERQLAEARDQCRKGSNIIARQDIEITALRKQVATLKGRTAAVR